MSGGPVPVWKKYTTGSRGVWETLRQWLTLVPNRSTGNPYVPLYRVPVPGNQPGAKDYKDPVTFPTAEVHNNPYHKRDHRRNYPQVSSFDQTKISGLLTLGNLSNPRIGKGKEGDTQLSVFNNGDKVYLNSTLAKIDLNGAVLGKQGEPITAPDLNLTKKSKAFIVRDNGIYSPEEYPVRIFNYQ